MSVMLAMFFSQWSRDFGVARDCGTSSIQKPARQAEEIRVPHWELAKISSKRGFCGLRRQFHAAELEFDHSAVSMAVKHQIVVLTLLCDPPILYH